MLIRWLIIKAVWQAFLIVALAVMGIFYMVLLIGELGSIGHFGYTINDALWYCLLLLPSQLYSLLPMLGFLSAIIGLGRLSSQNELVSIRAAGFSRLQITRAVMWAAVLLIAVITWVGERYAYDWASAAKLNKAVALKQSTQQVHQHVWMKSNHYLINIGKVTNQNQLANVTLFKFNGHGQVLAIAHANKVVRQQGQWQLQQPHIINLSGKQISQSTLADLSVNFDFKPSYLNNMNLDPSASNIQKLWQVTHYRWFHHLAPNQISFAFWLRLLEPLNTLIMIWLGIPFVFGTLRHATMGYRLLMGIVIGFGFYMLNQVIGPLCMLYQWPPLLAALIPSLILLALGYYLFKIRKN